MPKMTLSGTHSSLAKLAVQFLLHCLMLSLKRGMVVNVTLGSVVCQRNPILQTTPRVFKLIIYQNVDVCETLSFVQTFGGALEASLAMLKKGEATDQPCTPLWKKKRSHCKRGSSQQNLRKQDNGKRTKFWCEVMNFRESTELWLTGLNVKHVQCETMLMTMVVTSTCHMFLFFVKIFHAGGFLP